MLGASGLLPEAGVSCSESYDLVLHPLDRFADELNEEDLCLAVTCLFLYRAGCTQRPESLFRILRVSAPKRDRGKKWGHLSKVKKGENKEKSVGSRKRKPESGRWWTTERDRMTQEEGWGALGRGWEQD